MLKLLLAAAVPKQREGGVAGIIYELAERYRAWGHSVDTLFREDLGDVSKVPRRLIDGAYAYRLSRFVRQNANKYSVVNLHAPWGFAYGRYRRRHREDGLPPYVMTLQGAEERFFHAMKRESAKGLASNFRWKNRAWHRLYHGRMYRQSIRTADYAIAANREAFADMQLHDDLDAERVYFVPNGVNEIFFRDRRYEGNGQRLLFVGTWLDRKGTYYLEKAFEQIAARWPDARLTIAGCLVEEALVRRAFPEELQKKLVVKPLVGVAEMPELYAAHDIFVFPSLMEGMPLSLLEAMASGMPVVTTDTCGMADVVEDEFNGLLVKPATIAPCAEAVGRLLRSAELRERLGRSGQETMRRYTWDVIAKRYLAVLEMAATSDSALGE